MRLKTSTDLKAARRLLGLELADAAILLGASKAFIQSAERPFAFRMSKQYRDALWRWESHAQHIISRIVNSSFQYVIVYTDDEVYRRFEPDVSLLLPLAKMHLAAAGRAKAERESEQYEGEPIPLSLVQMAPDSYEEFRNRLGYEIEDHDGTRQGWAKAFAASFVVEDRRKEAAA